MKKSLASGLAAMCAALVCSCGGGGSALPTPAPTTVVAVATPTAAPSGAPTTAPTVVPSVPTTAPTATPVPLALRVIGGAPLSATASQLANARRAAQAKTQAQGVTNGLPVLVESSGMVAAWAGDMTTWVSAQATAQDVPETGMTVTPSGNLALNNPAPAQSCLGSLAAACIAHPTAFTWGTSSANGKPVGKQTITVAFSDGTSGTTSDYVYDGWSLGCNAGWAYVGGVPVAQATRATSDVYADCVAGNIDFPVGAALLSNPTQDQYGRYETIMPSFTAQPFFTALNSVVPMTSISQGMVFAIQTKDGGFAKVYFQDAGVPTNPNGVGADGMALHSQPNGSFAF